MRCLLRPVALGLALSCAALVGCADPAAAPGSGGGPVISDLAPASRNVTAGEQFGLGFQVRQPGSGMIVAYGLATRLGEARYVIGTPIPVIANGAVTLSAVGPLPNQRQAGTFTFEFWVEDARGGVSNRLTADLNVQ